MQLANLSHAIGTGAEMHGKSVAAVLGLLGIEKGSFFQSTDASPNSTS